MSEKHTSSAPEKSEFELDRLMLFSDAVFAIAITLLVIDIKWPELPENGAIHWDRVFGPLLLSFLAFVLSFIIVGRYWAEHLRLFRLVRKYDQGLINHNLFFLFFIVLFPFAASAMWHIRIGFTLPIFVYLVNLVLVSGANFYLCRYIFKRKPDLTVKGEEETKKYFYFRSLHTTLAMLAMLVVVSIVALIIPNRPDYIGIACGVSGGLSARIANKKVARLKPKGHY